MKKVLIGIGVFIVIAALAITFLVSNLGSLIKKGVETAGPRILLADVRLAKAEVSLAAGSGELTGLTIGNPQGFTTEYAFDMDRIRIELEPQSVASDTIHFKQIVIEGPKIIYEGSFGKSNIQQLRANAELYVGRGKEKTTAPEDDKAGKKVVIDYLRIAGAEASLAMNLLPGQKETVSLSDIELKDIGKKQKADFAEVTRLVLAAINQALVPAIQKRINELGLPAGLPEEAGRIQEETRKELDKFKGLLGR